MHPFLAWELGKDFELQRALRFRLIPLIWEAENLVATLQAYVDLYLWEEVQAEASVRDLGAFTRFLKAVSALRPAGTLNQSPQHQPILWISDHWNPSNRTTQKQKWLCYTSVSNLWKSMGFPWFHVRKFSRARPFNRVLPDLQQWNQGFLEEITKEICKKDS